MLTMKDQKGKFKGKKSIYVASKRTKYLGINLPKETKDMHSEKFKTLKK